jgi:hypothetical protein
MGALEGAAKVSRDQSWQRETQPAKPALSPTSPRACGYSAGSCTRRGREGNHATFFSDVVVTGPAATKTSSGNVVLRANASVRAPAAARWNAFGSANGAGAAIR